VSAKLLSPPPVVLSMALADNAYRDPATGKFFVLGTYNAIMTPSYPCRCKSLTVYVALTECHGRTPVRLALTDADEEMGAVWVDGSVDVSDPTAVCEGVIRLDGVVLPSPGQYRLQLRSGEDLLRELRLDAREMAVPAS
jgi:hypothetical protein